MSCGRFSSRAVSRDNAWVVCRPGASVARASDLSNGDRCYLGITRAPSPLPSMYTPMPGRSRESTGCVTITRTPLVTRTMIYDHLFDENDDSLSNLVDVHVANIRKKLGKDFISTRRGEGYEIIV